MPPQKAQSDPSKSRSELSGRTQVVSTIVDNMVAHTGVIFSAQKTPQPVQLSTPAPQRVPVVFDPKISKGSLQRKTLAARFEYRCVAASWYCNNYWLVSSLLVKILVQLEPQVSCGHPH